jgi:hypothetical protein
VKGALWLVAAAVGLGCSAAPGWYFVSTLMEWYDGSYLPQSYVLRDSVLAQRGRTVTVVLTRMR